MMQARHPFNFDAIAEAFAEEGFERASMERIAERARVAKRTLYYHFTSKEELFDAAVEAICDNALDFLFVEYNRAEQFPAPENIRITLQAFFTYAEVHPSVFEIVMRMKAATPASIVKIEDTIDRITERISEAFYRAGGAKGRPTGRVTEVLAVMTVGAADHVARLMARTPGWDKDPVIDLMTDLWAQAFIHVDLQKLADVDHSAPPRPKKR